MDISTQKLNLATHHRIICITWLYVLLGCMYYLVICTIWLYVLLDYMYYKVVWQNPVSEWILMMRSLNWISAISLMCSSRSTHSLGFVFILWCYFEYISSNIVYFYLKYYGIFLYSKSSRSPITESKMFHITAPWCQSKQRLETLPLIPNNCVINSLDLLYKIQENLDISHNIQVVRKHRYFNSKTESSHTSQDHIYYLVLCTTWLYLLLGCIYHMVVYIAWLHILLGYYMYFMVACTTWLYVLLGYMHYLVICTNWLYVLLGYKYYLVICTTWLYALIGYIYYLVICTTWLYVLHSCISTWWYVLLGCMYYLVVCTIWLYVLHGCIYYLVVCTPWLYVQTWLYVQQGIIYYMVVCIIWYDLDFSYVLHDCRIPRWSDM